MKIINFEKPMVGEKNYSKGAYIVGGALALGAFGYGAYQGGKKLSTKNDQIGGNHVCTVTPQDCGGYTCYGC